jgi:hypothetical protein
MLSMTLTTLLSRHRADDPVTKSSTNWHACATTITTAHYTQHNQPNEDRAHGR